MGRAMKRWELSALGRENLMLVEAPVPEPEPGEVLVKVMAVALNYRDGDLIRTGLKQSLTFPITLASDAAGTAAAGESVTRFKAGDRVISVLFPEWIDGAPQRQALGRGRPPPDGRPGVDHILEIVGGPHLAKLLQAAVGDASR